MDKFTTAKKSTIIINSKNKIDILEIKAISKNKLISYSDIEAIYNGILKTNPSIKHAKIIGRNRYKTWTIKTEDIPEIQDETEYFKNKANSDKINGFYSFQIQIKK